GQTYQVHVDHLGTPKALTDVSGQVVWKASYSPFGKASIIIQGPTFNLRFPGQYYDAETGFHYNWRRYYDPATGRYITSDPLGLIDGVN
ncbi:RHS repeat-associated core domain-containing protein, partial [Escherichia coli]